MKQEYKVEKPKNLSKIDTNDMGALLWWSYIFGTNPEKILAAVDKGGNDSRVVRDIISNG